MLTTTLCALSAAAFAQGYPNKPIRLVVTFPPGGAPDILARLFADKAQLGQPVAVDNKPGAGGNIGAEIVAKSPADGYTLVMGTVGTHSINRALYGKMPYDMVRDLAPVAHVASAPNLLVVNNDLPAKNVAELITYMKANPDKRSFDSFNIGGVATAPIISVAEAGSGVAWRAAFVEADPGATLGTVVSRVDPGTGPRTGTFRVDTSLNRYFTFASMVVPSNDFFIGNDDPMEYLLLDMAGKLLIPSITVGASEIWDAGSEVFDPAAAAFVGTVSLRRAQNSVVAFNFAELAAFNGLMTAAGYNFDSALTADSDIYRIDFSVTAVPEPGTYALMAAGLMAVGFIARRRRADTALGGRAMA